MNDKRDKAAADAAEKAGNGLRSLHTGKQLFIAGAEWQLEELRKVAPEFDEAEFRQAWYQRSGCNPKCVMAWEDGARYAWNKAWLTANAKLAYLRKNYSDAKTDQKMLWTRLDEANAKIKELEERLEGK